MRLEAAHRPCVVTGLGNRELLRQFGLRNVRELDWWQRLDLPLARARHGVPREAFQVLETGETRRYVREVAPAYAERISA